jgi:glucokinase
VVDCVIALDVGGSVMKGALVERSGRSALPLRRPTEGASGPAAVVDRILETAAELREQAGRGALAAGVVVPGIVDEEAGIARRSVNLGWHDVPLRKLLEQRLGLPVALGHDVRAGALAEGRFGAARGLRHYLFMPIGTGIGGAVVLDGRPYSGADGSAGEIGHLAVRPDGPECRCGGRGCLETIASAAAIAERYRLAVGAPSAVPAEVVVERARAGDPEAVAAWREAVDALATAIVAYATLLAPEAVVVGGGLALAGDALLVPLAEAVEARTTFQRPPQLLGAELGDEAGCLGAALAAWCAVEANLSPRP